MLNLFWQNISSIKGGAINEQLYGEERLSIILEKYKNADVKTVCDEVKKDVDVFVGEAPQFDDITMLALRYNGTEGENERINYCGNGR